ncbi:MAG: hypothetical protein OHK0040_12430 [bacterium]
MFAKKQINDVYLLFRGPQREAKEYFSAFVPTGLFNILFFLLKQGYNPKLFNLSTLSEKEVLAFIKSENIEIAFISTFMGNHNVSLNLAKEIKRWHKKAITVLGGPFAILGEAILNKNSEIDFVILGEGEISSLKLLKFLEEKEKLSNVKGLYYRKDGEIKFNKQDYHKDIDDFFYLPSQIKPYCHYVKSENFAVLITSRGCPYRCSFCSSPVLWKNKIRLHSIDNLINYVKDLRKNIGEIYFSVRDDNFLMNKKRVLEFAVKLTQQNLGFLWNTQGSVTFLDDEIALSLAESGCDQVQLGIESASKRLLELFEKPIDIERSYKAIETLRKHLIRPFGYFIGGANETDAAVKETCLFIKKSGLIDGVLSPLVIYPGTKLSNNVKEKDFFSEKEIHYYSQNSYKKVKNRYLRALEFAHHHNWFTQKEIDSSPVRGFLKEIVRCYSYLNSDDITNAKKALFSIDSKNPWRKRLLKEIGNRGLG